MIELKQAAFSDRWLKTPGRWRGAIREGGEHTATVSCPDCGESASLSGHTIARDGTVNPSVVCPHEGCGFHEFVRLAGWEEAPDGR